MTTEIPPDRVPPIAKEVASTRMMWAALIWCVTGLFVVAVWFTDEIATDLTRGQAIGGIGFWIVVTFALGLRQYRFAKRAEEAGRRATAQSATFVLADRMLLAYEPGGIPQPAATFKLSRSQATMLTALPKAEIRS